MVDAKGDDIVLGGHGAGDAQGGDDGVEEGGLYVDGQVGVFALGGAGAFGGDLEGRGGDFADGVGVDVVAGSDEVVGVPLSW